VFVELIQPPDRGCVGIVESFLVLFPFFCREIPDRLVSHGPVPVKPFQGRLERRPGADMAIDNLGKNLFDNERYFWIQRLLSLSSFGMRYGMKSISS